MSTGDVTVEDALVGRTLSERYKILKKLGEGGMGVVYLAEHILIEKKVALKILSPDLTRRGDLVARFLQEAKSASRIGHENVIDISDFGQSPDGFVYFAMEFLDGQDLGQALKGSGGHMAWERAKPILLQICRALRAAHNRSIIHRDMKPENVYLIQREGRPDFVKVLDFGIAKVMGLGDETPRLTRTGMIFGTPDYMSPEQAQGQKFDHRVDIYAVGCIMHQLVTGETPFKAESFMGILSKHMFEAPIKPSLVRPELGIPPEVDAIVLCAMEKDASKRFPDMTAMGEAIAVVGGGSTADVLTHQKLPTIEMGGFTPTPTNIPGARPGTIVGTPMAASPMPPQAPLTATPPVVMAGSPQTIIPDRRPSTAMLDPLTMGTSPPPPAPVTRKSSTALIAVVVAVLAAGGGGAAMFLRGGSREAAPPAAAPPPPQATTPPVSPPPATPPPIDPNAVPGGQPGPGGVNAANPGGTPQPSPTGKGRRRGGRGEASMLPPLPSQPSGPGAPPPPPPPPPPPRTKGPDQQTPRELKNPFGE